MSTMIETKDLTFTYPAPEGETNPPALRGVSVTVEKGTFVVVLGHNGSGKSTLAKHMNAVLLPSGGAVYVEGMDTRDESLLLEIRRRTGMVFQNPDNQIVANVVEEDVAFGPENLGVPTAEIRRRVDDALAAVGMEKFARHAPHLLSGTDRHLAHVAIAGCEAAAVLQPHRDTAATRAPGGAHTAIRNRHDRRAVTRFEIDPGVHPPVSEDRVAAHAEVRGDRSRHGCQQPAPLLTHA